MAESFDALTTTPLNHGKWGHGHVDQQSELYLVRCTMRGAERDVYADVAMNADAWAARSKTARHIFHQGQARVVRSVRVVSALPTCHIKTGVSEIA